jgi:hypothetical protein
MTLVVCASAAQPQLSSGQHYPPTYPQAIHRDAPHKRGWGGAVSFAAGLLQWGLTVPPSFGAAPGPVTLGEMHSSKSRSSSPPPMLPPPQEAHQQGLCPT